LIERRNKILEYLLLFIAGIICGAVFTDIVLFSRHIMKYKIGDIFIDSNEPVNGKPGIYLVLDKEPDEVIKMPCGIINIKRLKNNGEFKLNH